MTEPPTRLSWDHYFLLLAKAAALRATCLRGQVGAVLVQNQRVIATGYNGAPSGLPHCTEVGCRLVDFHYPDGSVETHCRRVVHAESNALAQASRHGVAVAGASLYAVFSPCVECATLLINAGVTHFYYEREYRPHTIAEMVAARHIHCEQLALPAFAFPSAAEE